MIPLLKLKGIYKSFNGNPVLKNVDFDLYHGEIHALIGENGAGKSTLMKIISGIIQPDSGTISILDRECRVDSPQTAGKLGIAMIHQELNLIPSLTVMENIFLGHERGRSGSQMIRWKTMEEQAYRILDQLGVDIDPHSLVEDLSVGEKQIVEIARAVTSKARILILDEPTAALTEKETESLFQLLRFLKLQGVGMIYITHRMEEIFRICDRVTVLRDGHYVNTKDIDKTNMNELIFMMVGQEMKSWFPKRTPKIGSERIRVVGLSDGEKVRGVSFSVYRGEILGIAGLLGSGRTEIADMLFGIRKPLRGKIFVDGKQVQINKPEDAIHLGFGYVTEDRKKTGLILTETIENNLTLPHLSKLNQYSFIEKVKSLRVTELLMNHLKIKPFNKDMEIWHLSGGNQQKVFLGKWIATKPKLLILDEPTRGIDLKSKAEIYHLICDLADQGISILLISSDFTEVLKLSDRILVMYNGRIQAEFSREEATHEILLKVATGGGMIDEIRYARHEI